MHPHLRLLALVTAAALASGCSHWSAISRAELRDRIVDEDAPIDVRVTTRGDERAPERYVLHLASLDDVGLVGLTRRDRAEVRLAFGEIETVDVWVRDDTGAHAAIVTGLLVMLAVVTAVVAIETAHQLDALSLFRF